MNLKIGDTIKDIKMSVRKNRAVYCEVISVSGCRFLCDNKEFPQSYPHSFYDFTEHREWEKL
jgi:uncharacterized Zn-finger protein